MKGDFDVLDSGCPEIGNFCWWKLALAALLVLLAILAIGLGIAHYFAVPAGALLTLCAVVLVLR